ncbi:hypothetical protein [Cellulomonas telluris]|uniref:hypothetical protein n=1 Tax=Cellulomonas telluris TaxID=2306636 RepID=UPI0010A75821|nr:hypothetical protein [Cellulomonas telluris]
MSTAAVAPPLPRTRLHPALAVPATALAVVVVTAGAVLAPLAAGAAVGLGALVVLFWRAPRTGILATVVGAVLAPQLQVLGGGLGGLDEAMVVVGAAVVTVRRLVREGSLVRFPGTWWFAGFAAAGVVSSYLHDVPGPVWLQGMLLLLKAVLLGHTAAQLHWSDRELAVLVRAGAVGAVVLVALGLVNLAVPGPWTALVAGGSPEMHGPFPALLGPFRQPAAYGRLAVILAASVLAYQLVVRASLRGYALAAALSGLSLLTFRVKSFVGLVVVTSALLLRTGPRPLVRLGLLALPALLLLAGPVAYAFVVADLSLYYGEGQSARSLLTAGGLVLAERDFPLGAGFGRYGSATAAEYYSPEYLALGFEYVWGLGRVEGWGAYLNDTQWPALLGETGWLGTVCYAAGVLLALRVLLVRVGPDESALTRWLRISGVCCLVLVLLDSVGASAFTSPPSYALVFLAPGVVASMRAARAARRPAPAPVSRWTRDDADAPRTAVAPGGAGRRGRP